MFPGTAFLVLTALLQPPAPPAPRADFPADPAIACGACAGWNAPRAPSRLYGNTWYVGVTGLSSVLITSPAGHVLIDGGLPQSAPLIDANIRALGFRTEDVKLILNSHAHFDHAGGIAALQQVSGAVVAATAPAARALEAGEPTPDDPQYGFGRADNGYPPVRAVRVIADGEVLRVGDLAVTAHATPGHTPGGTTWSWRSCEADRCVDVVYADSLTAVSAPGFSFLDSGAHAALRASIARIAALPCDLVVAAHPSFTDLDGKLERRAAGASPDPLLDPNGCRTYAAAATERFEQRLADERRRR